MTKKELKLLAGSCIIESNLSISKKKELLNYTLTESNKINIKSIILDNKIIENIDIDSNTKEIINLRFENFIKNQLELLFLISENKKEDDEDNVVKQSKELAKSIAIGAGAGLATSSLEDIYKKGLIKASNKIKGSKAYKNIKSKISPIYQNVKGVVTNKEKMKKVGKVVIATLVIILAARLAKKLYNRYFSEYTRQCNNVSSEDKDICIKKARVKAIDIQINSLKSSLSKCNSSNNPDKCKNAISSMMRKLIIKRSKIF